MVVGAVVVAEMILMMVVLVLDRRKKPRMRRDGQCKLDFSFVTTELATTDY